MKKNLISTIAGISIMAATGTQAAAILDANNDTFMLSGTTTEVLGRAARFNNADGSVAKKRWASFGRVGNTQTALTVTNVPVVVGTSTDYYFQIGAFALGNPVNANRYAEVSYSLKGNWTGGGATHAFRLDDSVAGAPSARFVPTSGRGLIGSSDGDHTFIIDLLGDGNPIGWSGNWKTFRWDMFNNADNSGGKRFTLNSVTFANEISAVPVPDNSVPDGGTTVALLGLSILGLGGVRRYIKR